MNLYEKQAEISSKMTNLGREIEEHQKGIDAAMVEMYMLQGEYRLTQELLQEGIRAAQQQVLEEERIRQEIEMREVQDAENAKQEEARYIEESREKAAEDSEDSGI